MEQTKINFPVYNLFHPFDGSQEMKFRRAGSFKYSLLILVLWFFADIMQRQLVGFSFFYSNPDNINIFFTILRVFGTFIVFVACNWAVTTLLDGEGRFSDIFNTVAYAMMPYIVTLYLYILLSHFMVGDEGVFIQWLVYVGMIWSGWVALAGLKTIHDYSMGKTVFSVILTILGILIIVFLILIFASLINEIGQFLTSIYKELSFRM